MTNILGLESLSTCIVVMLIEQADVAALMASLIGVDWPVNSMGSLPDIDTSRPGYLNPVSGDEAKAKLALVNAQVSE
jgi:phosphatidylinositol glycan class N